MNDRGEEWRVAVFGEVLFDVFPGEEPVIGGAPFNVARHLQGFGLEPLFISCVGMDELGKKALELMEKKGMNTRGVQKDKKHPTGVVQVEFDAANNPQYEIKPETAWDYIQLDGTVEKEVEKANLFYHGSLASRSPVSKDTLLQYLKISRQVFCDLNLRTPWWEKDNLLSLLNKCNYIKLNDSELAELTSVLFGWNQKEEENVSAVFNELKLKELYVTHGEKGASTMKENGAFKKMAAPKVTAFVDSVGAGDAFAAVVILGILQNWEPRLTLERATTFSARICQIRGALPRQNHIYWEYCEKWRVENGG